PGVPRAARSGRASCADAGAGAVPLPHARRRRAADRHAERAAHARGSRHLRIRAPRRRAPRDHRAARADMSVAGQAIGALIDDVYRRESRRVLATLIRLRGDFDLAEEALHDAFRAAVEQWPTEGVPDNPRAWLVSAGRFKAIDSIRRRKRFDASEIDIAESLHGGTEEAFAPDLDREGPEDDRLRLR